MDLTPYLNRLREDLGTAASAGDEQTQRAAAVLSAALEPAARLTLMNALADLAAEVTANLPDQVVEVRLDGRDVRVVVTGGETEPATGPSSAAPPPPPPPPPPADAGDISRITLRLFEQIKSQAEQQAAAQGVSLNTFVSQAVQGALQGAQQHQHWGGPKPRGGNRSHLHGWVEG
ncbi:toxin-antitoxin system HicB family antitoxin [Prauserella cavernicola]|uniref:Toxin-antitoxin system HicB family antitoxin n=1 Tax=Prauserella cavernicola TaxID=2800127 RepID=A0A934R0D0_9PSEU|nr:toxin-antitoxin system HicB family antitoxin [Prauserella cavernicola]MBK1788594.1 toxin-antitoxin system HicB family antitoxin [Prauserella cavernicola]